MKILSIFLLLIIFCSCKGKINSTPDKKVIDRIVDNYNHMHFDSIFFSFSKEMKVELPLDKTIEFFTKLKNDAGSISKYESVSGNDTTETYRIDFLNKVLSMKISKNESGQVTRLLFTPFESPIEQSDIIKNHTKISLPFNNEWFVFWEGDTKEENYNSSFKVQRHDFDFLILDAKGMSYRTDGKSNDDYYVYGQKIIAPCDAKVISIVEGIHDNVPGKINSEQLTGNSIVLATASNEYLLLTHLKENSISVKYGETVKKGQLLGLCGNSGNSSEPHLRFHTQNRDKIKGAKGFKCYFEKILVNGELKKDYSPVKGEKVQNAN